MHQTPCPTAASMRQPRPGAPVLRFTIIALAALFTCALPVLAQNEPYLVKDINETGGSNSNPRLITDLDGIAFFVATEAETGTELWQSDGTEEGTSIVADLNEGSGSTVFTEMRVSGGKLFFVANNWSGGQGAELWMHDPATGQTGMVLDIAEGPASSSPYWLTDVVGTLYFAAYTEEAGVELWKSGGDAASTERVRDLEPGAESSNPQLLTACSGALYFRAWTSANDWALWKSDGTAGGTIVVHAGTGSVGLNPSSLTEVGGRLFFAGDDEAHGYELWLHDPVAGTTGILKDVRTGIEDSRIRSMTDVDGTLFFVANDGVSGVELWRSDGTQTGTHLVEDIYPGSFSSNPSLLTALDGSIFFVANGGSYGSEIWTSDGTPAPGGTRRVTSNPASTPSRYLTESGGKIYFVEYSYGYGLELWVTDGSEAGTRLVRDIFPGPGTGGSGPHGLTNIGGTLFFTAKDGTIGRELWRSNGTPFGTAVVKDINPGGGSHSYPIGLVAAGEKLFFSAQKPGTSLTNTLWVTDGTALNTIMLKEASGGVGYRSGALDVNGVLFFSGLEAGYGSELCRSDGTNAGTFVVKDIAPGNDSSGVANLTKVGGRAYFSAWDAGAGHGIELWSSDGTEAGTSMVADINVGYYSSTPKHLVEAGGKLFFTAEESEHGRELWMHDPVMGTTDLVKDIRPGPDSALSHYHLRLAVLDDKVYFAAEEGFNQFEIWVSDGTESGTDRITVGSQVLPVLAAAGGQLFFWADSDPAELWVSGGTQATTTMVKQIAAAPVLFGPLQMTAAGDRIYFVLDDGVHGFELWTSDGTEGGTHLVKDIWPGESGSFPSSLTHVTGVAGGSDRLFFSAVEPVHSHELWVTDGSQGGTRLVADLWAGSAPSQPQYLVPMLNTLYFSADDGPHGFELWAYQFATDADGDGLPDDWEVNGYTHSNGEYVDLKALGATPDHKDIFVEVDHMAGAFDHEPHADAMAAIVTAFANAPVDNPDGETGIRLHINARAGSRSVLAFQDVLGTGPDANHYDWTEFDVLKAANFSRELEWSHHYCIFAHKLPTGEGTDSGVSRGIAASDFIVSLGAFTDRYGGPSWIDTQAGTFMHELGHNLGLGHGGTDNVNHKPNYLSVMNYTFIHRGLIHTDPLRKWDYSREALPDLDENALDEGAGLGGTDPDYGTKHWCSLISDWVETAAGTALAWIDWDLSEVNESEADPPRLVPADLNKDLRPLVSSGVIVPGYEAEDPLRGANDWERILFEAGRIGGGAAAPPRVTEADEIDRATSDEMRPDPLGKVKGHAAMRQIILTWQPAGAKNSGITYNVYRSGGETAGPIGNTDRSNYHDRNVTSGTTYVYSVTWVDAQGVESAPSEVTVTAK